MSQTPHWTDMLLASPIATRQYIVEEDGKWICRCENTDASNGFSTCNEIGERCEATPGLWDEKHYVCENCYLIIDGDTLEALGVCSQDVVNTNEEYRWHEL